MKILLRWDIRDGRCTKGVEELFYCNRYSGLMAVNRDFMLVGGLEQFLCFHILGIIPTDELILFRRVETTNQL